MSRFGRATFLDLGLADWVTLSSLVLSCLAWRAALGGAISLGIALLALSMLTDMLDGPVARRTRGETPFGRHLDSLADVFVYLVAPMAVLYRMGQDDRLSLVAILAYFAAGVLRLAHFNVVGAVPDAARPGAAYHVGLPVIWSHLVVALAFPAWHVWGAAARPAIALVLLAQSALMVSPLRFRKLTWYAPQAALILAVAAAYMYLHLTGLRAP